MNIATPPADAKIGHNSAIDLTTPVELAQAEAKALAAEQEVQAIIDSGKEWDQIAAIEDDENQELAVGFFKKCREVKETIDAARKKAKGPFEGAADRVSDAYNVYVNLLDALMKRVKPKMDAYTRKKIDDAEAARKAAEAAAKAKAEEAAQLAASATSVEDIARAQAAEDAAKEAARNARAIDTKGSVKGVHGSSSATRRWKHRVTDPTLVPREYLVVDDAKIKLKITIAGRAAGELVIPGIEFLQDISTGVR